MDECLNREDDLFRGGLFGTPITPATPLLSTSRLGQFSSSQLLSRTHLNETSDSESSLSPPLASRWKASCISSQMTEARSQADAGGPHTPPFLRRTPPSVLRRRMSGCKSATRRSSTNKNDSGNAAKNETRVRRRLCSTETSTASTIAVASAGKTLNRMKTPQNNNNAVPMTSEAMLNRKLPVIPAVSVSATKSSDTKSKTARDTGCSDSPVSLNIHHQNTDAHIKARGRDLENTVVNDMQKTRPVVVSSCEQKKLSSCKAIASVSGAITSTVTNSSSTAVANASVMRNAEILCESEPLDDIDLLPPTQPAALLVLDGVVAFVDVRIFGENCSSAVYTQLKLMGAVITKRITKTTTHVIFKEGTRATYRRAKQLRLPLVSVRWVESCRQAMERLPERDFEPSGLEIFESPLVSPVRKRRFCRRAKTSAKKMAPRVAQVPKPTTNIISDQCLTPTLQRQMSGRSFIEQMLRPRGRTVARCGTRSRHSSSDSDGHSNSDGNASSDSDQLDTPLATRLYKRFFPNGVWCGENDASLANSDACGIGNDARTRPITIHHRSDSPPDFSVSHADSGSPRLREVTGGSRSKVTSRSNDKVANGSVNKVTNVSNGKVTNGSVDKVTNDSQDKAIGGLGEKVIIRSRSKVTNRSQDEVIDGSDDQVTNGSQKKSSGSFPIKTFNMATPEVTCGSQVEVTNVSHSVDHPSSTLVHREATHRTENTRSIDKRRSVRRDGSITSSVDSYSSVPDASSNPPTMKEVSGSTQRSKRQSTTLTDRDGVAFSPPAKAARRSLRRNIIMEENVLPSIKQPQRRRRRRLHTERPDMILTPDHGGGDDESSSCQSFSCGKSQAGLSSQTTSGRMPLHPALCDAVATASSQSDTARAGGKLRTKRTKLAVKKKRTGKLKTTERQDQTSSVPLADNIQSTVVIATNTNKHHRRSSLDFTHVMPRLLKATPTVSKTTPTVSKATPTVAKTTPTVYKATPTVAKTTPTTTLTTPTTTLTTPTVSVDTPTASLATPTMHLATPPALVFTNQTAAERVALVSAIEHLGGINVVAKVNADTTHVISGLRRRTLTILRALATGAWLLSPQWIIESRRAGRWLAEEPFELHADWPAARAQRIRRRPLSLQQVAPLTAAQAEANGLSQPLLSVGRVFLSGETCPPRRELASLLRLAGVVLVSSARGASVAVGGLCRCACVVSELWALDSLECGRALAFEPYLVKR